MTTWRRSDDWIGSLIDDSFVMISIQHGTYVALNATAASVWELFAEPRDEAMIVDGLLEKFAVDPARCRNEVRLLLGRMAERELILPVA